MEFDVFLSHNSNDKPAVRDLARRLKEREIRIWLDEEQLVPGESVQRSLEEAIKGSRTSAVLVGKDGLGPWEDEEMQALLRQQAKDPRKRVIPVLLPDAPKEPELPLFLTNRVWVDLRPSITDKGLSMLVRGIKGEKPDASQVVEPAPQRVDAPAGGREPLSRFRDRLRIGSEGPEMVVIPSGSFLMGSPPDERGRSRNEGPLHRVEIQRSFAMGRTPVTAAEYALFAEAMGRKKPLYGGRGRRTHPIIMVSWHDAKDYADWLSGQSDRSYRLPSEAEWEYVARAGTTTAYSMGDRIMNAHAHFCGSLLRAIPRAWISLLYVQTMPVGSFPANPWGLCDMHGNVREWVQDCWHESYRGAPTNGSAWKDEVGGDCGRRVVRGGAWNDDPEDLRSANRYWFGAAAGGDFFVGFRLAQDL